MTCESSIGRNGRRQASSETRKLGADSTAPVDMSLEAARASCEEALALDACSGEAWFRLGISAISVNENPADGAPYSIAGAVLIRHSLEQWNNAALGVSVDVKQTLRDVFYAGYHLNGNALLPNGREHPHVGTQRGPSRAPD